MIIRRLIVALAVASLHAGQVVAQGAFPAPLPLPGQVEAPASNDPPFPALNGVAPSAAVGVPIPSGACMNGFAPLRAEAVKRGSLIKAASQRHARPDEACKLITSFGQAELEVIKYVEANSARCGIPPGIGDQLKTGHNNTEKEQKQVCTAAAQWRARPAGQVGDFEPYYR